MLGLAIPYIVGLVLGIPLALRYPRFRTKSLAYRLGVGLLVGVGIAITINASLEVFDLVEEPSDELQTVANSNQPVVVAEVKPETKSVEKEQPQTWKQEQHYADGTRKAMRTVTRDAKGEIVPHGPASTYYLNGQLKWTGNYELGKQVGAWSEHYPDGVKEGEGNIFEDGHAEEKYWHQNGNLKSEGKWRQGVKHGLWKTWHSNGQLAGEFRFEAGKLHGRVREWHPNGQKKLEAEFSNGIPAAPVKRWSEHGTLVEAPKNGNPAGDPR